MLVSIAVVVFVAVAVLWLLQWIPKGKKERDDAVYYCFYGMEDTLNWWMGWSTLVHFWCYIIQHCTKQPSGSAFGGSYCEWKMYYPRPPRETSMGLIYYLTEPNPTGLPRMKLELCNKQSIACYSIVSSQHPWIQPTQPNPWICTILLLLLLLSVVVVAVFRRMVMRMDGEDDDLNGWQFQSCCCGDLVLLWMCNLLLWLLSPLSLLLLLRSRRRSAITTDGRIQNGTCNDCWLLFVQWQGWYEPIRFQWQPHQQ